MEQNPFLRNLDERAFNPMNDVAFKFIFGKEERKSVTIDFLNILYPRMWTRSKKGWGKTGKTLFR